MLSYDEYREMRCLARVRSHASLEADADPLALQHEGLISGDGATWSLSALGESRLADLSQRYGAK